MDAQNPDCNCVCIHVCGEDAGGGAVVEGAATQLKGERCVHCNVAKQADPACRCGACRRVEATCVSNDVPISRLLADVNPFL
jgi:hypothetical protein